MNTRRLLLVLAVFVCGSIFSVYSQSKITISSISSNVSPRTAQGEGLPYGEPLSALKDDVIANNTDPNLSASSKTEKFVLFPDIKTKTVTLTMTLQEKCQLAYLQVRDVIHKSSGSNWSGLLKTSITVEYSTNGTSWTTIANDNLTITGSASGDNGVYGKTVKIALKSKKTNVTKVRLNFRGSTNYEGFSEVQVYGQPYKTLTLDPNNGTISSTSISNYITATSEIPLPTRTGYRFTGWTGTGREYLIKQQNIDCDNNTAVQFDGTSTYKNIGRTFMFSDLITINVHAWMADWSEYGTKNMRLFSCTQDGGFNIEPSSGKPNFACYDKGVNYKHAKSSNTWASLNSSGTAETIDGVAGRWHTFTCTFNGTNTKFYIDGNLEGTSSDFTSNPKRIGYHDSNSILIGAEAYTGSTPESGKYFKGYIKNFGIAHACFSESQINDYLLLNNASKTRYYFKANATIQAQWIANTYTVKFDKNGGTGTMANQSFTYGTAKNLSENTFTKASSNFTGWNTKADGTGTSYSNKQSVLNLTATHGATVTLYAQWNQCQLTIDPNGGTYAGSTEPTLVLYPHESGSLTLNQNISRTGYTFMGWSGTGAKYLSRAQFQTATNTCSTERPFVFTGSNYIDLGHGPKYGNQFVVNFWAQANWTSLNSNNDTVRLASALTNDGTSSGKKGWHIYIEDSNSKRRPSSAAYDGATGTNRTVRKYSKFTDNDWHMITMIFSSARKLTMYVDGVQTEYLDDSNKEVSERTFTNDMAYNANYTVLVGAAWNVIKGTVYRHFTGQISNFAIINRELNSAGVTNFYNQGRTNPVTYFWKNHGTNTTAITANWKANSYTIAYNANGGSGSMTNSAATYDEALALRQGTFSRAGYIFMGWNTAADGSGTSFRDAQRVRNLTATDGATVTLYAQWEQEPLHLCVINKPGDTLRYTATLYGEKMVIASPTRAGFTFIGWDGIGERQLTRAQYHNDSHNNDMLDCSQETFADFAANDYIDLGKRFKYEGAISVNLWAQADWINSMGNRLISCRYDNQGWEIYREDNTAENKRRATLFTRDEKSTGSTRSTVDLIDNGEHMFTFTFDTERATGYLDGVPFATSHIFADTKITYHPDNSILVGAKAGADNGPDLSDEKYNFIGKIRNLGIINRALTQAEITEMLTTPNVTRYYFESKYDTLEARWRAQNYTITFEKQGGTGGTNSYELMSNDPLPEIELPTRENYTFVGYFTQPNGEGIEYYNDEGEAVSNFDLSQFADQNSPTLYAYWHLNIAKLGENYYSSLQAAIDAAEGENNVVQLVNNNTEDFVVDRNIVLQNPDNKTITGSMTVTQNGKLTVESGQSLTITDSCTLRVVGENSAKIVGRVNANSGVVWEKTLNLNGSPTNYSHWISLPFAANVRDIRGPKLRDLDNVEFDLSECYGSAWQIVEYNSMARGLANSAEPGRFWDALDYETGVLEPKKGYILQFVRYNFGEIALNFRSGNSQIMLNTADTEGKTVSDTGGNSAHRNWWLVGQPYFCTTHLSDGPQYVVKMVGGNDHYEYHLWWEDEALRPYESFFVQYNSKISFENPNISTKFARQLSNYQENNEYILLNLTRGNEKRRIGVILSENGSNDYVQGRDLAPIENNATMNFYSFGGQKLIFNDVKNQSQSIALGFTTNLSGKHTISLTNLEKIGSETRVELEDLQLGTRTNLRLNDYEFFAEKGTSDNRFVLHINKSVTEISNLQNNLIINELNGTILVENCQNSSKIALFDAVGRQIATKNAENGRATFVNLASGVYLLQVENQTAKVVVR